MAKQEVHIKILAVSFSDDGGGAANAATRIQTGVNGLKVGISSSMFVKEKRTKFENIIPLNSFLPHHLFYRLFDWFALKLKNKIQHFRWNRYPNREPLFMSDLRSTRLGGALQKLDFDILHLHWINKRFIDIKKLPIDKPIVWTLHDSWPFTGVCHIPYDCKGYEKGCGRCPMLHSDNPKDLSHEVWSGKKKAFQHLNLHIVTPSRWLADCARNSSLLKDCDIRVIPNCIDTEVFCPGKKAEACKLLGLDSSKRYMLFGAVNALTDPNKGYAYLRQAIQQTVWPKNLELIVIGADKELIDIKNIPTHYFGYIGGDRLVAAYRVADVMVVPSLSENLSCAIMESLSCATPVCCFNIGGNGDMVEHKVNGYLAKEKDAEDLGRGILWCLENNSDNHLGKAARESVIQKYSIPVVAKQYAELYKELAW
ncbi:MAG: glycosyltransferase family 4 protein [Paludibacteraceae bacterium]|nr:glycosyltransferase family 4 protein [Paludibacteraceae bacterium]